MFEKLMILGLLVFLTLTTGKVLTLTQIEVHCGQLSVEGYDHCELSIGNQILTYVGPEKQVMPGLWFGLITYTCDKFTSHLESKFDCKGCNFYCSYDEYISDCHRDDFQFWMGAISGVCVSGSVGFFLFRCLCKRLHAYFSRPYRIGGIVKYSRTNLSMTEAHVNDENLIKIKPEGGCHGSMTPEFEDVNDGSNKAEGNSSQRAHAKKSSSTEKKIFKSVIIGLLALKLVNSCDVTLVMKSSKISMICDDKDCSSTVEEPFPIKVGQKICFTDHSGGEVSLSFSDVAYKSRFELAYFTSNFIFLDLETQGACCNSCTNLTSSPCLNDLNKRARVSNRQNKTDLFCIPNTPRGNVVCSHTREKLLINKKYSVYTILDQFWSAKITLMVNGKIVQERTINDLDPILHLSEFQLDTVDRLLPVTILLHDLTTNNTNASLFYENSIYFVNASKKHDPRSNLFGDYQTTLTTDGDTFLDINCNYYRCNCTCKTKNYQSMLGRFIETQTAFEKPNSYLFRKKDHSVIETVKQLSEGTFDVRVGSSENTHSAKAKGMCDIEFVASSGSVSREKGSYIHMLSQNITKRGLVPFYSNCSFNKMFVMCDYEPTKLIFKDNYDNCFIALPTIRKKMLITIEYFDSEHQNELTSKGNCNIDRSNRGNDLQFLLNSRNFIGAFVKTIILCSLFGLFLTCLAIFRGHSRRNIQAERATILLDL